MTARARICCSPDGVATVLAAGGLHLVEVQSGHRDHAVIHTNVRSDLRSRRERPKVRLDELAARRVILAIGRGPAIAIEKLARGRVHVVFPGREDPNLAPTEHARADDGARLEHERSYSPLHQVRRGGESDRAGANDRDGKLVPIHLDAPLAYRRLQHASPY